MADAVLPIALVQMTAGRTIQPNVETACHWIRRAAEDGARFVLTPETTHLMELKRDRVLAVSHEEANDPGLAAFTALAGELGIWLLVGSLIIRIGPERLANRSFLIGPDGTVRARYDKIHLFDVTLASGESYRESALYAPGDRAVVAPTDFAPLGLSVCYDVRFPALYRSLAQAGAEILTVPAAFTRPTGEAHWHTLLRARAIETGSFVLAPAQTGEHETGRATYGHSLVVSPWGEVLADGGTEPGLVRAELDLSAVAATRARIPSLRHDRPFAAPDPVADTTVADEPDGEATP
ncbi:carbon-nitrogen hydrolase family protein [Yunchengibacter salinarum]|uniref:carbon-nitrogen hydrolase family protein n=1 Tax=Yunchengibacter salinarum TaxID=3133399 RepID=UPI0035B5DD9E